MLCQTEQFSRTLKQDGALGDPLDVSGLPYGLQVLELKYLFLIWSVLCGDCVD